MKPNGQSDSNLSLFCGQCSKNIDTEHIISCSRHSIKIYIYSSFPLLVHFYILYIFFPKGWRWTQMREERNQIARKMWGCDNSLFGIMSNSLFSLFLFLLFYFVCSHKNFYFPASWGEEQKKINNLIFGIKKFVFIFDMCRILFVTCMKIFVNMQIKHKLM